MTEIAAIIFVVLMVIVSIFQLALALGVPWGEYAMGGAFPGKYPLKMRIAALFQIFIYLFMGMVVLSKSGLYFPDIFGFSKIAIWFIIAIFVIGTILNLITKSKWERRIWGPVNILILISCLIVAFS